MIRGYVSSDEDDYDEYDFGYSDPLIITNREFSHLPEILTKEVKEELYSVLEEGKKIELFLKAVDLGDLTTLEELIRQGVSPDSTDSQHCSALMKACGSGCIEIVRFLLEHKADPNKHKELFTPLMTCCTHTLVAEELKLGCIRLLLEYGAEVNAKDKYRTTALMYASSSGYVNIVTEFLGVPGIDINVQDKEGWTALFHAVNSDNLNIVKKLMSAGSALNLKDKYERTVINLALDRDFKEVAEALGYVEENLPDPEPTVQLSDRFLKELPDSNGQGGFTADAQNILQAFNQFNVKNINLPDLLNATEKDLYEIGVKLQPDRQKILSKGIHRYHLQPWKATSMHQVVQGVPMRIEDAIAITGALASHLTIANASLRYLETRIFLRQNKEPVDLTLQKETICVLINTYNSAKKLNNLLPKIIRHIEQIKPEITDDYIYPHQKEKFSRKCLKYLLSAVSVSAAGLFICHCKWCSPFRVVSNFVINGVISFFTVYQSLFVLDIFHHY